MIKHADFLVISNYTIDMNLYHSSPIKNLKTIKPQHTLSNNKYIGDFVFATKDKKLSLMYMLPKGFPILMNSKPSSPYVVICGKAEDVVQKDNGGALYILPSETFHKTPQKELNEYEMVSRDSVSPIDEIDYANVLNALNIEGISIYFVDDAVFSNLIDNPEQDNIVKHLERFSL